MIKDYVVHDEYINYSGPFEIKELYKLLNGYFKTYHYARNEKKHFEKRTEEGRVIELELEPFKTVSDYIRLNMGIRVWITNIKDISVEIKGKNKTLQQGDVSIRFRSFVIKDYTNSWESNPFFMFIRAAVDKFIYKTHIGEFADELVDDTKNLQLQIKSFLNLYTRK